MSEPSTPDDRTIAQDAASADAASEKSLEGGVSQHPEAPKLAGYVLVELLGRGTFGEVWLAWQTRTRRWVAAKVFMDRQRVHWDLLRGEIERLSRLDSHRGVVALLDADLNGEPPFCALELEPGGSLERFATPALRPEVGRVAEWLERIAEALAFVHAKGIIHCDLKPANILLDEGGAPRLADFGQARVAGRDAGTLGTLFFMAPEQAAAADEKPAPPDVRWDVYALGATAFSLLTGRPPHVELLSARLTGFSGLSERLAAYREALAAAGAPALTAPGLDEDLAAIVTKCLEPEPPRRYGGIGAVLADLRARREGRPVGPLSHRKLYRAAKFARRNLVSVGVAAAALVALSWAAGQIVVGWANAARLYNVGDGRPNAGPVAHAAEVTAVAASSDGRLFASASQDGVVKVWDARGKGVAEMKHAQEVFALAFSPDGKRLATGCADGAARLWESETGRSLGREMVHGDHVHDLVFSPDGRRLFSASEEGKTLGFWEVPSGLPAAPLVDEGSKIYGLDVSPDGRLVATASLDKTARLWNAATGKPVGKPLVHAGRVLVARFSPDGRRLLTAGWDETARIWDVRSGTPVGKPMRHEGTVRSAVFSSDGRRIVTGAADNSARVWDAETQEQTGPALEQATLVKNAFFLGAGERVATTSGGGNVRVWDVRPGLGREIQLRHALPVFRAEFSPDSKLVATASRDGTIGLWSAENGRRVGTLTDGKSVRVLAFSPGGERLLSVGSGGARVWKIASRERERDLNFPGAALYGGWSAAGRVIFAASQKGLARIWDEDGRLLAELRHPSAIRAAALSPDGRWLVTAGRDGSALLWDSRTGKTAGKAMLHDAAVNAVAFSPDGRWLATGSEDKTTRLWSVPSGSRRVEFTLRHRDAVRTVNFSPDGRIIATGGEDQRLRLWDAATGEARGRRISHGAAVRAAAFSADGSVLISGSDDRTVRLWDVSTGMAIGRILKHGERVIGVALSPDGRRAATASVDGAARLWSIEWVKDKVSPELLLRRAQLTTMKRVGVDGQLESLSTEEWRKLSESAAP